MRAEDIPKQHSQHIWVTLNMWSCLLGWQMLLPHFSPWWMMFSLSFWGNLPWFFLWYTNLQSKLIWSYTSSQISPPSFASEPAICQDEQVHFWPN
jgi:hypothetical protein